MLPSYGVLRNGVLNEDGLRLELMLEVVENGGEGEGYGDADVKIALHFSLVIISRRIAFVLCP